MRFQDEECAGYLSFESSHFFSRPTQNNSMGLYFNLIQFSWFLRRLALFMYHRCHLDKVKEQVGLAK